MPEDQNEFSPPESQEALDRIISERLKRERSKFEAKYADYAELKARAAKADAAEEADKSELQKAQERIDELDRKLSMTEHAALRSRIQAKFGIADEDAELFLTASDEDGLNAQAARVVALKKEADEEEASRKKSGPRVSEEGRKPKEPADDEMREFAAELFGKS